MCVYAPLDRQLQEIVCFDNFHFCKMQATKNLVNLLVSSSVTFILATYIWRFEAFYISRTIISKITNNLVQYWCVLCFPAV